MQLNFFSWVDFVRLILSFVIAFVICMRLIPVFNSLARKKGFLNAPNGRTSHRYSMPNFGGVSIFLAFCISMMLFIIGNGIFLCQFKYLFLSLLFIFIVGVIDDINDVRPELKLVYQIVIASLLVFGGFKIDYLFGFLGLEYLNGISSFIITVLLIVMLVNSVNFIDGIDGLASLLSMVILGSFGIWFCLNGEIDWGVICFSMVGALLAFFVFNVFGRRNKTLMGDSGSLVLGLLISVVFIKFIAINQDTSIQFGFKSAIAVAIGFVAIPLSDLCRVFFLRIINGKSPFSADKNHLHHRLLDLGLSHVQASILMSVCCLCLILVSVLLGNSGIMVLFLVLFLIILVLVLIVEYLYIKKNKL